MDSQPKEKTIAELVDSINSSIEEMREEQIDPKKAKELPSDFEILISGVNGASGMESLFSPAIDKLLSKMFELIVNGDYESILTYEGQIKRVSNAIFGEGSFQGPVSTRILSNLQNTMGSYKYNTMKSCLGKTMTNLKKVRLIMKNLKKGEKGINDKEELQKYRDAIYAIKQVLKMAEKVYRNRKLVNQKVYRGIKNIIHEEEAA